MFNVRRLGVSIVGVGDYDGWRLSCPYAKWAVPLASNLQFFGWKAFASFSYQFEISGLGFGIQGVYIS